MPDFPKRVRLLGSSEFRRVYEEGSKYSCPLFAAFCAPGNAGRPRVGFTVPRAVGKAVVRNRIKRRFREAVRLHLEQLNPRWEIVFNPRRKAHGATFQELTREVERVFRWCNAL